ncbi:hypothetical protein JCM3765_000172 [Sporobolomyces pararoseus]
MATSSSSYLFFGVFVKAHTLGFAADAWESLKPVLQFFDLVDLRIRRGNLSARKKSFGSLPMDLLTQLRDHSVRLVLEEAEQRELAFIERYVYRDEVVEGVTCKWKSWESMAETEAGEEAVCESDGMTGFLSRREVSIETFLAAFGLECFRLWGFTKGKLFHDLDLLVPIALSNDNVEYIECVVDENYGYDSRDEQDFTSFDPKLFQSIPPSASHRFSKFIRTFHLVAVDPSLSTKVSSSSEMAAEAKEPGIEPENEKENRRKAKMELEAASVPQWRLWAISEFNE